MLLPALDSPLLFSVDDFLFDKIFQPLNHLFQPSEFHSLRFKNLQSDPNSTKLSKNDILGSLIIFSHIKHDDVKFEVLNGLLLLLQHKGQLLVGSWLSVLKIIQVVPLSMNRGNEFALVDDETRNNAMFDNEANREQSWSKASLSLSFQCISLIVSYLFVCVNIFLMISI